ncbi:MAG: hypothetical protein QXQ02_05975 [Halobacteria archaeon]
MRGSSVGIRERVEAAMRELEDKAFTASDLERWTGESLKTSSELSPCL